MSRDTATVVGVEGMLKDGFLEKLERICNGIEAEGGRKRGNREADREVDPASPSSSSRYGRTRGSHIVDGMMMDGVMVRNVASGS